MTFIDELNIIFELTVFQFKQIFPYWLAGVLAGSLLSVHELPAMSGFLGRLKNARYNVLAALLAAVLGVASPVCMFGTIPLIVSLGRKGVPQYVLATFMTSSILLNPNLLLLSFSLGTPIALLRLFSSVAAGLLAGVLVKVFFKDRKLFELGKDEDGKAGCKRRKTLLKDLHKSITITAPYFLAGILITAIFDRYVPKDFIVSLFGRNEGFGVLLAASLGVPLYVCGGGTIPLLRLWMQQGMTPGSAIAFMLTGPATKLTNLSALKIVLGMRNFVLYIIFSIVFGVIVGIATDAALGLIF